MSTNFKGITDIVATFNGNVSVGDLIKLEQGFTVSRANDGDELIGVCVSSNNNVAGIQLRGVYEFKYIGTPPTLGYSKIAIATDNKVKTSTTAYTHLVINVDTVATTVTILI